MNQRWNEATSLTSSIGLSAHRRALAARHSPLGTRHSALATRLERLVPFRVSGQVVRVAGLTIEATGLPAQVGEICHIYTREDGRRISAEVVGFHGDRVYLMPFGDMNGVSAGCQVQAGGRAFTVPVGRSMLGRVLDGLGNPIDGLGALSDAVLSPMRAGSPSPLARPTITEPLQTGIRAIDGLLTCGRGQRMGIFAGSGVGKSTLVGMIARSVKADVNVIALIGERGREVQEFIQQSLGEEGLRRSVVVVSTSDQPALLRTKAVWVATAIAEHFRDAGLDVNLMMDSLTRFAMAQREIGLAVGEPPALKGYPPSVFTLLPKVLERAGTSESGTITGFYTILVEGDDTNEPISDTVRSILDGHIVLSRDHASENHYPAIDVLHSVSRLMPAVVSPSTGKQQLTFASCWPCTETPATWFTLALTSPARARRSTGRWSSCPRRTPSCDRASWRSVTGRRPCRH